MTRGAPDWGVSDNDIVAVSTDTNELAVRLGSTYRISRTGHVLYATDFVEDFKKWRIVRNQSVGTIAPDLTKSAFGKGCLAINLVTAVNGSYTLSKRLPYFAVVKWGIECLVWFALNNSTFQVKLTLNDGANDYVYGFKIDTNADTISVLDSNGTFVTVINKTITPALNPETWFYVKLILNNVTHTYQSLTINDDTLATITQTPDINANAVTEFTNVDIDIDNTANTAYKVRIGSFVLTVDEP